MKIITEYPGAREEKDVIEFKIQIGGKIYRVKESIDGKVRFSAHEGRLIIEPETSNLIAIDQCVL